MMSQGKYPSWRNLLRNCVDGSRPAVGSVVRGSVLSVRGPVLSVAGSLLSVRGLLFSVAGSVLPVQDSVLSVRGSLLPVRGTLLSVEVRCYRWWCSLSQVLPGWNVGCWQHPGLLQSQRFRPAGNPRGRRSDSPALSALPYLVPPTPQCAARHAQLLLPIPKPAAGSDSLSLLLALGRCFSSAPQGYPSLRLPRDGGDTTGPHPSPFSPLPGAESFSAPCPVPWGQ